MGCYDNEKIIPLEIYAEGIQNPLEHLKMELSAEIVNGFQPITIFPKRSILDVRQGFEYASNTYERSISSDFSKIEKRHKRTLTGQGFKRTVSVSAKQPSVM